MKKNFFVSLIPIFWTYQALAETDRIQSLRFDRSVVKAIHLAPGLGSIVLFPCPLLEVFVGRSQDLRAQISPNDKKTLFLNLKLNSSLPTNFIARCEGERNVFVFDVIPSRVKHQDVVEIRGFYGSPSQKNTRTTQITADTKVRNTLVLQAPKLIEQGGSR